MRIVSTLLLCLIGTSAFAANCDRWGAKMEEDEGGPVMMASICTKAGADSEHDLLVGCSTTGSVWLRFIPAADESYPPGGNEEYKTKMQVAIDQDKFALDAQYEGMDGALSMAMDMGTPIGDAFLSGKAVTFTDPNSDKVPVATFTLKGAKKAFAKLLKTCEK